MPDVIRIPQPITLPPASFKFQLTMDTLTLS